MKKTFAIISAIILGGVEIALFAFFPDQADASRLQGMLMN